MGFLSKLRAKLGKSIDNVTEEINHKINHEEPSEIINEQINLTEFESQKEKISYDDFHKDEESNEFQNISNNSIKDDEINLSTENDLYKEESIIDKESEVILEQDEVISSSTLLEKMCIRDRCTFSN